MRQTDRDEGEGLLVVKEADDGWSSNNAAAVESEA